MTEEEYPYPKYELVFVDKETKVVVFAIDNVTRIFSISHAGIRYQVDGRKRIQHATLDPNEILEVRRL